MEWIQLLHQFAANMDVISMDTELQRQISSCSVLHSKACVSTRTEAAGVALNYQYFYIIFKIFMKLNPIFVTIYGRPFFCNSNLMYLHSVIIWWFLLVVAEWPLHWGTKTNLKHENNHQHEIRSRLELILTSFTEQHQCGWLLCKQIDQLLFLLYFCKVAAVFVFVFKDWKLEGYSFNTPQSWYRAFRSLNCITLVFFYKAT